MGSKKNVDMTQNKSDVKIIKAEEEVSEEKLDQASESKTAKVDKTDKPAKKAAKKASKDKEAKSEKKATLAKKSKKLRGKKYQAVRAQLDKTKAYKPAQALTLVKKFSYAKFDASVEVHIVVKEVGTSVNLTLPHSTGKSLNVVIANDQVLSEVEKGNIDFDVLLASPELMPKLAKLAKILGPKGLMPNPKNGTLTPKPELKKKELEAGAFTLKTEKKAPLMHLVIGKVSMDDKVLEENLLTIIRALKNKIVKIVVAPSMGPAIRVDFELEESK
jgi:large subunit ribosomal protein L1